MKAMRDIRMAWRVGGAQTWLAKPRRIDSRTARAEGTVLGPAEIAYLHTGGQAVAKACPGGHVGGHAHAGDSACQRR
eukprot:520406-Alexandrium_andersonii.AAC.1